MKTLEQEKEEKVLKPNESSTSEKLNSLKRKEKLTKLVSD